MLTLWRLPVLQPHPPREVIHEAALLVTDLDHLGTTHRQQPCRWQAAQPSAQVSWLSPLHQTYTTVTRILPRVIMQG